MRIKKGDLVQVFVDKVGKEGEGAEEVRIEVPVSLVDAILSGEGEEINLKAAIAELQNQRGNIVTVREKDTSVRIWIDEQNAYTDGILEATNAVGRCATEEALERFDTDGSPIREVN